MTTGNDDLYKLRQSNPAARNTKCCIFLLLKENSEIYQLTNMNWN